MWLTCACTPRQPNPPASNTIELNDRGEVVKDGAFTTDGYAVNNVLSSSAPRSPKADHADRLLVPQTQPTIGDRLSEKGIDWAWYAGGWSDALAGHPDPTFQFHHQPYVYFSRYAEGTDARQHHLKDSADLEKAIEDGNLPAVAFYKPLGRLNEHPGDTDLLEGEEHVAALLKKLEASPQWPHMVVIVTYDEHGGYWDHVPPPKGDRFGPGSRIPTLIVSPFSLGGRIDSTVYDTTSILKLIEERFEIDPLGERDRKANSLSRALKLGS
jgi:phospholipase C